MSLHPIQPPPTLHYCDFCGKSEKEVAHIIAGPGIDICGECVQVCVDILKGESGTEPEPAPAQ